MKAWARLADRVKTVFSSAGGRTGSVAAVSNAIPPIRIDKTDWVCTVRPFAESDTSTPLRVPKAGVRVDVLVVRRLYEHLDSQILTVLVEFVRRDLAYLQPPEVYRRAGIQRTQVGGLQDEKPAGISPVITGGVSSATKSLLVSFEEPISTPI